MMKSNSLAIIPDMGIYQVRNGFRKIERIPREGKLKNSKQFIEFLVILTRRQFMSIILSQILHMASCTFWSHSSEP